VNLWRELDAEGVEDMQAWARENFDPRQSQTVNPTWHPVVRVECAKMIAAQAVEDMGDMGSSFVQPLVDWLAADGFVLPDDPPPDDATSTAWRRYVDDAQRATMSHPDLPEESSDADGGL